MEEKITNSGEETTAAEHRRHLGDNIRRLRMMLGMKQGTLAELTSYTQSAISKIENKEDIDGETLAVIARAFRVPVELIQNFRTEEIVQKNQTFNDRAQQFEHVESIEDNSTNTTTNELDVIKFALEANQKVNERIIKDKDTRINELKAEVRELKNKK